MSSVSPIASRQSNNSAPESEPESAEDGDEEQEKEDDGEFRGTSFQPVSSIEEHGLKTRATKGAAPAIVKNESASEKRL
jgi:hypothetical protein